MAEEFWVIEVNMDSTDPTEFRVKKADDMLKTNAVRALIKVGGLPTKLELANWITIGMARGEKEADQKLERFREITISERAHATSTGESLYLKL